MAIQFRNTEKEEDFDNFLK